MAQEGGFLKLFLDHFSGFGSGSVPNHLAISAEYRGRRRPSGMSFSGAWRRGACCTQRELISLLIVRRKEDTSSKARHDLQVLHTIEPLSIHANHHAPSNLSLLEKILPAWRIRAGDRQYFPHGVLEMQAHRKASFGDVLGF